MHARTMGQKLQLALRYAVLSALAIVFLIPFYLIVRNALMTDAQITSPHWQWFPLHPVWSNFHELFADKTAFMWVGLRNSAFIATTTLVLQMLFASMAGYALARIPSRASRTVFGSVLLTLMIPGAVTFVPTFALMAWVGGVNTLWGVIAPGLFSAFSIFLFRQFYLGFPSEIEEAGMMDGLGYAGIYWRLVLPNSKAVLMSLGVLAFVGTWNTFLWPLVVGQNPSSWTVQIVLSTFLTGQTIQLHELFAAALVAVLPLVVVFLFMQRYIVEGITFSGGKE